VPPDITDSPWICPRKTAFPDEIPIFEIPTQSAKVVTVSSGKIV
jgi:hypothetical protein